MYIYIIIWNVIVLAIFLPFECAQNIIGIFQEYFRNISGLFNNKLESDKILDKKYRPKKTILIEKIPGIC